MVDFMWWRKGLRKRPRGKRARDRRRQRRIDSDTRQLTCALGSIADLSLAGMRVSATQKPPLKVGQKLEFAVQAGRHYLVVQGRIIWRRRQGADRHDFGVQFVHIDPKVAVQLVTLACYGRLPGDLPHPEADPADGDVPDLYGILGLPRTATADQIRAAYHALARRFHPDANREEGADSRFMLIAEAYKVLRQNESRDAYDRLLGPAPEQVPFEVETGVAAETTPSGTGDDAVVPSEPPWISGPSIATVAASIGTLRPQPVPPAVSWPPPEAPPSAAGAKREGQATVVRFAADTMPAFSLAWVPAGSSDVASRPVRAAAAGMIAVSKASHCPSVSWAVSLDEPMLPTVGEIPEPMASLLFPVTAPPTATRWAFLPVAIAARRQCDTANPVAILHTWPQGRAHLWPGQSGSDASMAVAWSLQLPRVLLAWRLDPGVSTIDDTSRFLVAATPGAVPLAVSTLPCRVQEFAPLLATVSTSGAGATVATVAWTAASRRTSTKPHYDAEAMASFYAEIRRRASAPPEVVAAFDDVDPVTVPPTFAEPPVTPFFGDTGDAPPQADEDPGFDADRLAVGSATADQHASADAGSDHRGGGDPRQAQWRGQTPAVEPLRSDPSLLAAAGRTDFALARWTDPVAWKAVERLFRSVRDPAADVGENQKRACRPVVGRSGQEPFAISVHHRPVVATSVTIAHAPAHPAIIPLAFPATDEPTRLSLPAAEFPAKVENWSPWSERTVLPKPSSTPVTRRVTGLHAAAADPLTHRIPEDPLLENMALVFGPGGPSGDLGKADADDPVAVDKSKHRKPRFAGPVGWLSRFKGRGADHR